jgi:hypothetical protein
MSMDENGPAAQLKKHFEAFLEGAEPSANELACAPLLENWRATVMPFDRDRDPLPMALVIVGRVTGHPGHGDARLIRTSQLIWLDRNRKWARTWNRIYRLGEQRY